MRNNILLALATVAILTTVVALILGAVFLAVFVYDDDVEWLEAIDTPNEEYIILGQFGSTLACNHRLKACVVLP